MGEGCKNDIISVAEWVLGKEEITRRTNCYDEECSKATLDKNEACRRMMEEELGI